MVKLEEYVYTIVRSYSEVSSCKELSKRRVLSIFYLCDRASKRCPNISRLSSIDYAKTVNGPNSKRLENALDHGNQRHLFHKTDSGFAICNCPDNETDVNISEDSRSLINRITREYADMEEKELRKYIMTLPEVENTEKYTKINLKKRNYSERPEP